MGTRRKDYEMNKVRGIRGLTNLISIGCDVDRGGLSEGLCFMWRSYVDVRPIVTFLLGRDGGTLLFLKTRETMRSLP